VSLRNSLEEVFRNEKNRLQSELVVQTPGWPAHGRTGCTRQEDLQTAGHFYLPSLTIRPFSG
ncbi:MAG TPA: hypothetical protein VMX75_12440, partial [Spirochaetia bacterium]|nr:hypothetical protein [Spirochaetia bacterium]